VRIEIIPRPVKGYNVLFTDDASFKEVSIIKALSLSALREMGYQLSSAEIEEYEGSLFFAISSSDDRQVNLKDICQVMDCISRC